jgi:hypothetical protein
MDTPVPASALHIPTPCHADWSAMAPQGDGCRRFCDHCQHSVTDLSALPRSEAMRRLEQPDLCVRYTVDAEDNIVFADACTVEPRNRAVQATDSRRSTVKRRLARFAVLATSLISAPAVAGIPEAEASMRPAATETEASETAGIVDRFLNWLGVLDAEPAVEPIPEISTEPGGIVPDPVEPTPLETSVEVEQPRPIRMGRPARRLPPQPFSTQGQPAHTERSPDAPNQETAI